MKQKHLSHILAALTLPVFLCACAGQMTNSAAYEKAIADRQTAIANDSGAPKCTVHIDIQYAQGTDSAAKAINATIVKELFDMEGLTVKQAADSFATQYTRDYRQQFAALYREDSDDPEKKAWYEYYYHITSETRPGRKGVSVFVYDIDYYEGGAHGLQQLLTLNFDTKTGQRLTLDDILVKGYQQRLNELLLSALEEHAGANSVEALRDMGYLYDMEIFAPINYIIGEEGITFIYNPYEIAPYSMGNTELTIPYTRLEGLLKI